MPSWSPRAIQERVFVSVAKWPLLAAGGVVVAYCVAVLAYVASTPDLRLRCFLADDRADTRGVVIQSNEGMEYKGEKPEPGDLIIRVGEPEPVGSTRNYLEFSRQVFDLRSKPPPPGGRVFANTDLTEKSSSPWMVEEPNGNRWVAVDFLRSGESEPRPSAVLLQPLPLGEVVLSFVWFTLQLGVFVFAALAYWNRPYDHPSRLFLAMCIVTLGAYVGGFHWWIVGGRLWLTLPFSICAILLPAVALHFFLAFPRPKEFLARFPRAGLAAVYAVPVFAAVAATVLQVHLHQIAGGAATQLEAHEWLSVLRDGVYAYVIVAAVYFVAMLVAILHSLARTANLMERGQLRWICYAGMGAAVCVGYTLYLAVFDRHKFALGGARVPMFLVSLSFMFAYSVGIVRYRLMLRDQIAGKGFLYYLITAVLAVGFGLIVSLGTLAPALLNISLTQQQALLVAVVFMLGVLLLLWMRDMLQQGIDRQFFREKYQLDKALERVNRAVGHVGDPELIAKMMLGSCRDVLRVSHAALYLKADLRGTYHLAAVEGATTSPVQVSPDDAFLEDLRRNGSTQRVGAGGRTQPSPIQDLLRQMQAHVVHTLEMGAEIVGLVFLGRKENSASFTAEDLTFLNALGQITNVALHGAKMDRDIARLNDDLLLKADKIDEQKRQIALLQSEVTSSQLIVERPHDDDADEFHRQTIKGNSPALRSVLDAVRKVARTDATVLIRGESGTGKELLAQILHENGPRRTGPMIRVHCASLATSLLESELFGHVKGAFTGAHRDRAGRFQMADGGTLFLDEIGEISGETQVKLLRVLQERQFELVGGSETVSVNVRLIAATNRNLEQLIAEGTFREDLYYRLNVVSLTLPPLRDRVDDICELALHFLNRAAQRLGKRVNYIDGDALSILERYAWPGNVRELENVIERAVVMCDDSRVVLDDLPLQVRQEALTTRFLPSTPPTRARHGARPTKTGAHSVDRRESNVVAAPTAAERDLLAAALRECGGNKAEAARRLGLPRSTYYSKLKKYGIE